MGRRGRQRYLQSYFQVAGSVPGTLSCKSQARWARLHNAAFRELQEDAYECRVLSILACLIASRKPAPRMTVTAKRSEL